MSIEIDGETFDIPFKVIKRKAEILFKFAERTEDGVLHSEPIGTYYNYDVEMGMSQNNVTQYANLWVKVTEPTGDHTIVMPDESGSFTFGCYFSNINDDVKTWTEDDVVYFRNLSFSIIATSPARTP